MFLPYNLHSPSHVPGYALRHFIQSYLYRYVRYLGKIKIKSCTKCNYKILLTCEDEETCGSLANSVGFCATNESSSPIINFKKETVRQGT